MQKKIGSFFVAIAMAFSCALTPTMAVADQTYGSDTETIDGERTQANNDIDRWCETAKLVLNDVSDDEIAQLVSDYRNAHDRGGHFDCYGDYKVPSLDGGIYAERWGGIQVLSNIKNTLDEYGIDVFDIEDYARDKHEARVIEVYMAYKLLPLLEDKSYVESTLLLDADTVNPAEVRRLYAGDTVDEYADFTLDEYFGDNGFVTPEAAALDSYYELDGDTFGTVFYTDQHPNEASSDTRVYSLTDNSFGIACLRGKYERSYDAQQRAWLASYDVDDAIYATFERFCSNVDEVSSIVTTRLAAIDDVDDIDLDHDGYTGESDYKEFRESLYDVCGDDDALYRISACVMERLSDNRYIINDKLGRDHLEDLTLLHLVAEYDGRLSDLHRDANTFESNMQQAKPAFESSLFPNNAEGDGYLYDAGADCDNAEEFSERLFGAHTAGQYAAAPTYQSFVVPLWNRYCDLKSKTEAVSEQINSLPENITLEHRESVDAAYQAYSALTDNQRKDVARATNDKIISALREIHAEERHVGNFLSVMNRLPEAQAVALSDAEAIERCQRAYNNLTDEERDYAGDVSRLTDAAKALDNLMAQTDTNASAVESAVRPSGNNDVSRSSMYRLYNPNSGEHFYTASADERDAVANAGWNYEGIGWVAPTTSSSPVYRLYNAYAGDHHYTMSTHERDSLVDAGWTYEGIGWYSDDARQTPVYRQYNPNALSGAHNFTQSKSENDMLEQVGWRTEGIAWYGLA